LTATGILPKSATVDWPAHQIMNFDFPEPGIRSRQQPLQTWLTKFRHELLQRVFKSRWFRLMLNRKESSLVTHQAKTETQTEARTTVEQV